MRLIQRKINSQRNKSVQILFCHKNVWCAGYLSNWTINLHVCLQKVLDMLISLDINMSVQAEPTWYKSRVAEEANSSGSDQRTSKWFRHHQRTVWDWRATNCLSVFLALPVGCLMKVKLNLVINFLMLIFYFGESSTCPPAHHLLQKRWYRLKPQPPCTAVVPHHFCLVHPVLTRVNDSSKSGHIKRMTTDYINENNVSTENILESNLVRTKTAPPNGRHISMLKETFFI